MALLSKEEATNFFAELFYGEHHIPSEVKEHGTGFRIICHTGFSTYDYSNLTRLVFLAHDKCIRAEIEPHNTGRMKICIWKRERKGDLIHGHPTIEEALETWREKNKPSL